MIDRKTWAEFQQTGLLMFVNSFLHIFGWAICLQCEDDKVVEVYPAKVKFRGFGEESVSMAYKKLNLYMKDHGEEIYNDLVEGDNYTE